MLFKNVNVINEDFKSFRNYTAKGRKLTKDKNDLDLAAMRLMSMFKKTYAGAKVRFENNYMIAVLDLPKGGYHFSIEIKLSNYRLPDHLEIKILDEDYGDVENMSEKLKTLKTALTIIKNNELEIMEILY